MRAVLAGGLGNVELEPDLVQVAIVLVIGVAARGVFVFIQVLAVDDRSTFTLRLSTFMLLSPARVRVNTGGLRAYLRRLSSFRLRSRILVLHLHELG